MDFVRNIKETRCRVQQSKDSMVAAGHASRPNIRVGKERDRFSQEKLLLPDGTFINFDEECNKCFDIYFSSLFTKQMSLQDMLHYALQSTEIGARRALANSIVLTGGGASGQGFHKRLSEEYDALVAPVAKSLTTERIECKFKEVQAKTTAAWIGGSLLAKATSADKLYITKQEYDEKGSSCVIDKYLL